MLTDPARAANAQAVLSAAFTVYIKKKAAGGGGTSRGRVYNKIGRSHGGGVQDVLSVALRYI